jgi:hypothetical protein
MRLLSGVLALVTLTGCATVPMASQDADRAGKRFDPPSPGMAQIYIFRDATGSSTALNVSLGAQMLGALAGNTWFRVEVEPGQYDIRCNAENVANAVVAIAAGETRFVETVVGIGWVAPRCRIAEVAPSIGRPVVLAGHQAAPLR